MIECYPDAEYCYNPCAQQGKQQFCRDHSSPAMAVSLKEQKSKNIYLSLVVLWANLLICVTDLSRGK